MSDIMDLVMGDFDDHISINPIHTSDKPLVENKRLDNCNKIKFSYLCRIFEKVELASGRAAKVKVIFDRDLRQKIGGQSIFPLIRLLLPLNDPDRPRYGLKQTNVANTYIKALNLNKMSGDAQSLLHWKDPSKVVGPKTSEIISGDFGTILEHVLCNRAQQDSSDATIGEINMILDDLALAVGPDAKAVVIRDKIRPRFSASEQKWLMRVVFQDLKIGLGHELVLGALSPNALSRYNECTNMRTVVEELGAADVDLNGLKPMSKFSPMLAKGFSSSSHGQVAAVESSMEGNPFLMDVKLDGERMLVHIENNEVVLFSRNGTDYTDYYSPLANIIKMSVNVSSCILDGEVLGWDNENESFLPFGGNRRVGSSEWEARAVAGGRVGWDANLTAWLQYKVFDIMYVSGPGVSAIVTAAIEAAEVTVSAEHRNDPSGDSVGDISQLPLAVRRRILHKVMIKVPNRFEMVQCASVTALDVGARRIQLEDFFNTVTLAGEEGLVVKDLTSKYYLGEKSRKTSKWIKMKPEYGDQTTDLDFVVIGASYGQGKGFRGKGLSTFTCAVKDYSSGELKYLTICRVGGGFNHEELKECRERLDRIKVPWSRARDCPSFAPWKITKKDDQPDFFIPPESSFVVQIKFRYDKSVNDIMSLQDLEEYKNKAKDTTHDAFKRTDGVTNKKVGRVKKARSANTGNECAGKVDDIFYVSGTVSAAFGDLFKGDVSYCVVDSDFSLEDPASKEMTKKYTREEIISLIQAQGGRVVGTPNDRSTQIIVGNKRSIFQIQNYLANGKFDVVDFRYILDTLAAGEMLSLKSSYVVGYSELSREKLAGLLDPLDINYTDCINSTELSRIFDTLNERVNLLRKRKKEGSVDCNEQKIPRGSKTKAGVTEDSRKRDVHRSYRRTEECDWLIKNCDQLSKQTWREIAWGLDDDARSVLHLRGTRLWSDRVLIYLDVREDLGSCDETACPSFSSSFSYSSTSASTSSSSGSPRSSEFIVLEALGVRLRLQGARVAHMLHAGVTHVVCSPHCSARIHLIQTRLRELRYHPHHIYEKRLVTPAWAEYCLGLQLDPDEADEEDLKGFFTPLPEHLIHINQ